MGRDDDQRSVSGPGRVQSAGPGRQRARPARTGARALGCGLGLALALACSPGTEGAPERWNVLLVSIDTLRADRLGSYGYAAAATPTLDRLAREGVRFAAASAPVPITLPSHASLLTGRGPVAHGVRLNGSFRLDASEKTLAESLAAAGYATGAVIGAVVLNARYGLDQGFASYDDLVVRSARGASELEREAARVTDRARAWLEGHAGGEEPFFLWVHYFDPHQPYAPPPAYAEAGRDAYDGEIAYVDAELGRLLGELRRLGRHADTLVVVTSDHGEGLGEHGEQTHSYFVYETTLHVPLVWWRPGALPAGRVVEAPVRTLDVMPTLLDVLGLETPASVEGASLRASLVAGADVPELEVYAESMAAALGFGYSPLRALRLGHWKLILAPRPELYDLAHDPGERSNLAPSEPERVRTLRERLEAHVRASLARRTQGGDALALDPATRAQLQQLGYVGPGAPAGGAARALDQDLEPRGRDPKDVAELFDLLARGEGQHKEGRWREAEETFRAALHLDPHNEYALTYLAILYGEQGQVDRALSVFDALEGPPALGLTLEIQGKLQLRRGDRAAAIASFERLLEREPHNVWAHYHLGRAYRAEGRFEEARRQLEEAVRLEPSLVEARVALARLCLQQGEAECAEEHFRAALAEVPGRADLHDGLGLALQGRGDYAGAVEQHRRAVELDPASLDAREHLALALLRSGDVAAARQVAQGFVELRPESVTGMVVLAAASLEGDDPEWAALLLRRALERAPGSPEVWFQLARVRARREEGEAARAALERALELGGPSYAERAAADPALAPLR